MEEKIDTKELVLIKQLSKDQKFQTWVAMVVDPQIASLEAELASKESDNMTEVVLRAKLKQVNSLKHMFRDVFQEVHLQLQEANKYNSEL